MSLTQQEQELEQLKAAVAAKEAEIAQNRYAQLAHLPAQYGFKNAKEFCKAVMSVSSKKRGSLKDPEFKESVMTALKDGMKGADVARQFGLSVATIQNLKKAAGLVTARGA